MKKFLLGLFFGTCLLGVLYAAIPSDVTSRLYNSFVDKGGTPTLSVTGTGTAGVADTNVVTVQGIASGTVLPITTTQLSAAAALADGMANPTAGGVAAFTMGWRSDVSNWQRVRLASDNSVDVTMLNQPTVAITGAQFPNTAAIADATANPSTTEIENFSMGYNGTNWDRFRDASLVNFPTSATTTARNSIGSIITEKGSRWSVISNPVAGSQATASIAAELSVRHVADCISFSATAGVAPALTALTINLRDGASGLGTVIWTYAVEIPAATGQEVSPFSVCGLNLVGTTNTAMTLEFSASLANLVEAVSISGFNVN